MGVLQKLMPARDAQASTVKIIADLDSLVSQRIGFRFAGKDFVVEPVSTGSFIRISQTMAEFQELLLKKDDASAGVTEARIYEAYYRWISVLCPAISLRDIQAMKIVQLHALMNLMIRHITGQTQEPTPDLEKKN